MQYPVLSSGQIDLRLSGKPRHPNNKYTYIIQPWQLP